jgi:excinuclease ABC subunit B
MPFEIVGPEPRGDQPQAIQTLVAGIRSGVKHQTLWGATGTGKTVTMACVAAEAQRPMLVLVHNKVLAEQLCQEFEHLFPNNAVRLFVSTFDTFQPEAYDVRRRKYIKKDGLVDKDLYGQRLTTLDALLTRQDVIVVASVSAIFGVSSPEDYERMSISLRVGDSMERNAMLHQLDAIKYEREDLLFGPGKFRVRGECVDVYRPYGERAWRITFGCGRVERLEVIDPVCSEPIEELGEVTIRPATTFVLPSERLEPGIEAIVGELSGQLECLRAQGKDVAAARLQEIVESDVALLRSRGECRGMENYVRHFSGRATGETPKTLFDYFRGEYLLFIDESHATIPQIRNMHSGNEAVKRNLVDNGFRLPSAYDLRPMRFEEWEGAIHQVVFVSATPGPYELENSAGHVVEQIVRPTYLLDPIVEVRGKQNWLEDLIKEIRERAAAGQQVLVLVLTKREAESLAATLRQGRIKCAWIHGDMAVCERKGPLRAFKGRRFDVLVGVGLLREGVSLPGVSLVAIVDADRGGFLRSNTSLIQMIGRATRHHAGTVLLYADQTTDAMQQAMDETRRRRQRQEAYNEEHGTIPTPIEEDRPPVDEVVVA